MSDGRDALSASEELDLAVREALGLDAVSEPPWGITAEQLGRLFCELEAIGARAPPLRGNHDSTKWRRILYRKVKQFIYKAPLAELRDAAVAADPGLEGAGFTKVKAALAAKFWSLVAAASRDREPFLDVCRSVGINC